MSDKILDLMMQGMDQQGILTKVRAQIKASVYKMMDQTAGKKSGGSQYFWENEKIVNLHKSNEQLLVLELVKEFLQFFDLDYTLSVFQSECNHKEFVKRDQLINKIGLNKAEVDSSQPLLQHIVQKYNPKNVKTDRNVDTAQKTTPKQEKKDPVKPGVQQPQVQQPQVQPKPKPKAAIDPVVPKGKPAPIEEKPKANALNPISNKNPYEFQFEEIEEDIEDVAEPVTQPKKSSSNQLLTSSEEFLASQSQQLDVTVDSTELLQYDYVEEIRKK